jgi:adenylylsulfate kinase
LNTGHLRNLTPQAGLVSREDRERTQSHKGAVLWLTGLSGAGKSTLAHALEQRLHQGGCRTYVLDGDNVRDGLCSDLGFSLEHRSENIRRVGEAAKLFMEAGILVITAFISPLRKDREAVRAQFAPGDFLEIYCAAPLDVCERRDVKGLYRRARAGELLEFTGISSPYESPGAPEHVAETGARPLDQCVEGIVGMLRARAILFP